MDIQKLYPYSRCVYTFYIVLFQPCLCLCLGLTQMTITLPCLLTILHFSHMVFTDGLTFMLLPPRVQNTSDTRISSLALFRAHLYILVVFRLNCNVFFKYLLIFGLKPAKISFCPSR